MPPSSPSAAPLSKALTLTITVKQQICASQTCSTRFSMRVRSYLKKKKKITLLLRARRFNPPCGEPRATNHAQTCANVLFTPHFLGGLKSCIPPHPLQTTPSPLYLNQEAPRHVFFLFLFFYPFLLSCFIFLFIFCVHGATSWLLRRANHTGENRRYCWCCRRPPLKEDWQSVTSSTRLSCGCIWHRQTGEGYVHGPAVNTQQHSTRREKASVKDSSTRRYVGSTRRSDSTCYPRRLVYCASQTFRKLQGKSLPECLFRARRSQPSRT